MAYSDDILGKSFYLSTFDDLFKRPSEETIFGKDNPFVLPKPHGSFIDDAIFMSRSIKFSMLLLKELVFPAQWVFNNPVIFALTCFKSLDKECNSSNLLSSNIWKPYFDQRRNFADVVEHFQKKAESGEDPSAWWYDIYRSSIDSKELISSWLFDKYRDALISQFDNNPKANFTYYDSDVFKKAFRENLLESIDHIEHYSHRFVKVDRIVELLRKEIDDPKNKDLYMGKFRREIRTKILENVKEQTNIDIKTLSDELDDFARHDYLIAYGQALGINDFVFSQPDVKSKIWKYLIVEDVERRLIGYPKKSPQDDATLLFEVEFDRDFYNKINDICSGLSYLSNQKMIDLLTIEDIVRLRNEKGKDYFERLYSLPITKTIDSDTELEKTPKDYMESLTEYLKSINDFLAKKHGAEKGPGIKLRLFVATGLVSGLSNALQILISDAITGSNPEITSRKIIVSTLLHLTIGLATFYIVEERSRIDRNSMVPVIRRYNLVGNISA